MMNEHQSAVRIFVAVHHINDAKYCTNDAIYSKYTVMNLHKDGGVNG